MALTSNFSNIGESESETDSKFSGDKLKTLKAWASYQEFNKGFDKGFDILGWVTAMMI